MSNSMSTLRFVIISGRDEIDRIVLTSAKGGWGLRHFESHSPHTEDEIRKFLPPQNPFANAGKVAP